VGVDNSIARAIGAPATVSVLVTKRNNSPLPRVGLPREKKKKKRLPPLRISIVDCWCGNLLRSALISAESSVVGPVFKPRSTSAPLHTQRRSVSVIGSRGAAILGTLRFPRDTIVTARRGALIRIRLRPSHDTVSSPATLRPRNRHCIQTRGCLRRHSQGSRHSAVNGSLQPNSASDPHPTPETASCY